VIRHDDAIGARIDGGPRLIAAQNALDDELARPEVAEFPDVSQVIAWNAFGRTRVLPSRIVWR
jgi:hypothetical protein